ncbi:MAG TPA: VWA domain-containing protein [Polyangiaceae bacterium]|nr:VWA domain-containing protein [Polyangiaceae bacterium]
MARHRLGETRWAGIWAAILLAGCGGSDDRSTDVSLNGSEADEPAAAGEGTASGPFGPSSDGSASPAVPGALPASGGSDGDSPADFPAPPREGGGNVPNEPGTLTAGAWDDNRNLERFLEYRGELAGEQMQGLPPSEEREHRDAAARALEPVEHATLDIALVIDTTGSMSDELAYLQTEFDAIAAAIEAQYPNSEQRWALVVYRDEGDEYVTRSFDFGEGVAGFRERLEAQSAGGGGDYPEASHAALEAMNQLGWRSDPATAKLAFWVGDAPHHVERAAQVAAAVEVAASQDVHLYPVASSGVDELTEYSMRAAAQLTLGRYLFLTDDSGVGGEHKEPNIPCYFVTRLDDAILRMVDIEMSGVYHEPAEADVIRAGGNPADGACRLESGQTVFVF